MVTDIGLTHVALLATNLDASIAFYAKYANMQVVHERQDDDGRVVWISDRTRPFVIVLMQASDPGTVLKPFAHLGVGCASREEVDRLCAAAREDRVLIREAEDSGPPVGYWAFLRDPDGHTLELAHGQEVGLTVFEADSD
jgi:catechol 2,3-dioxygenase-like lactoylglutathione lyase family enzyme